MPAYSSSWCNIGSLEQREVLLSRQTSAKSQAQPQLRKTGSHVSHDFPPGRRKSARLFASVVAGFVSFMLSAIMSVNFGILVFTPVGGFVPNAVRMSIVGVGIIGNGLLTWSARLPCVVVTADNGVVAPVVAEMIVELANHIDDLPALQATSVAAVALACASFGCAQLLLVRMRFTQVVKFLPYSIPMGFLSGIGLELCTAISLAGSFASQAVAALFAFVLCAGSWWRGWPLSVLFPVLLVTSVSAFYLAGAPSTWLLEFDENPSSTGTAWLWSPETLSNVQYGVLARIGPKFFGVLFLLGSFQNILFADIFARTPGLKDEIDPDQVLTEFGQSFLVGGIFGFTGGFHNMACFSLSRELKSYARAPSAIVAVLSFVLWSTGLGSILRVPRFVFAGLLVWVGLKFLRTYLWQPAGMLPRVETAVIVCVAGIMKVNGFATGVVAGLVLALVGIVGELASLSCVQVVSSGHEARSNAMRSVRAEQLLLTLGHSVLVLRMAPGFVFFATSAQIIKIVERRLAVHVEPWQTQDPWFPGTDCADLDDGELGLIGPSLSMVVIDFTLCRGFDGSLMGVLQQLGALGSRYKFQLCLAGLQPSQKFWIKSHVPKTVMFFTDLDRTLEYVEDKLLANQGFAPDEDLVGPGCVNRQVPQRFNSDAMLIKALKSKDACSDWALLFLYSDSSAISRSARPGVAQAMALLERSCELFEADEDSCSESAQRFGPAPALILFWNGEPSLIIEGERMNAGPHAGAAGVAMLPVAREIVQEIEQHIYSMETRGMMRDGRIARTGFHDIAFSRQSSNGLGSKLGSETSLSSNVRKKEEIACDVESRWPSKSGAPIHRRGLLEAGTDSSDCQHLWLQFLQLAGIPTDSILGKLGDHITGPTEIQRGEILLYKGSARGSVYFVVNGLLSLWNEGRGHDQSVLAAKADLLHQAVVSPPVLELSQSNSRLLRVGPGWVLGGNCCLASGLIPQVSLVTCLAETQVRVLELPTHAVAALWESEPSLVLALQELIMHFNGQLLQHTAALLSDMHSVACAAAG